MAGGFRSFLAFFIGGASALAPVAAPICDIGVLASMSAADVVTRGAVSNADVCVIGLMSGELAVIGSMGNSNVVVRGPMSDGDVVTEADLC